MKFVVLFSSYIFKLRIINFINDTTQWLRYSAFIWYVLCQNRSLNSQDLREKAPPGAQYFQITVVYP